MILHRKHIAQPPMVDAKRRCTQLLRLLVIKSFSNKLITGKRLTIESINTMLARHIYLRSINVQRTRYTRKYLTYMQYACLHAGCQDQGTCHLQSDSERKKTTAYPFCKMRPRNIINQYKKVSFGCFFLFQYRNLGPLT